MRFRLSSLILRCWWYSWQCVTGFLGFFVLERALHILFQSKTLEEDTIPQSDRESFHHSHERDRESGKPLVANILFGGAMHSFMDGIAIATGFLVAHEAGVATTIVVLLHEVPHTVADVGVLIYGDIAKVKAVWANLLATSSCAVGGCFVLLVGQYTAIVTSILLPITAANLIYIALAILMPELQNERNGWRSLRQIGCLIGGLALMFALTGSAHETPRPSGDLSKRWDSYRRYCISDSSYPVKFQVQSWLAAICGS